MRIKAKRDSVKSRERRIAAYRRVSPRIAASAASGKGFQRERRCHHSASIPRFPYSGELPLALRAISLISLHSSSRSHFYAHARACIPPRKHAPSGSRSGSLKSLRATLTSGGSFCCLLVSFFFLGSLLRHNSRCSARRAHCVGEQSLSSLSLLPPFHPSTLLPLFVSKLTAYQKLRALFPSGLPQISRNSIFYLDPSNPSRNFSANLSARAIPVAPSFSFRLAEF